MLLVVIIIVVIIVPLWLSRRIVIKEFEGEPKIVPLIPIPTERVPSDAICIASTALSRYPCDLIYACLLSVDTYVYCRDGWLYVMADGGGIIRLDVDQAHMIPNNRGERPSYVSVETIKQHTVFNWAFYTERSTKQWLVVPNVAFAEEYEAQIRANLCYRELCDYINKPIKLPYINRKEALDFYSGSSRIFSVRKLVHIEREAASDPEYFLLIVTDERNGKECIINSRSMYENYWPGIRIHLTGDGRWHY